MFTKNSRYADTPPLASNHFKGTRPRAIAPTPGVIEHLVTPDDRLDRLAAYYYRDPAKWWLILDANPEICFGGDLDMKAYAGELIVIPPDAAWGSR
ncbi:MAG: hypothetical protein HKP58_02875 [Desulfatitalea sp.]|nr:hypothetical protein [Desulfatitalea sp.]NNJ99334.1 hypothetical protein [Desulfatitalea sp.]